MRAQLAKVSQPALKSINTANSEPKPCSNSDDLLSQTEKPPLCGPSIGKSVSDAVQQPHNSSLFLGLPEEIRAKILAYALLSPTPICIDRHGCRIKSPYRICWTCRQINMEAVPLFYAINTFRLNISRWKYVRRHWLKAIGKKNYCLIRSIQLENKSKHAWPRMDILAGLKKVVIKDKKYDVEVYRTYKKLCWTSA